MPERRRDAGQDAAGQDTVGQDAAVLAGVIADLHELADRLASPELEIAARLVDLGMSRQGQVDFERAWQTLTLRERLSLELLRQGHSYKQIAHAWGVLPATVRAHTCRALRKLGLPSRLDWLLTPPSIPSERCSG